MNQNESIKLTQQIQSCILALGMIPELNNLQIDFCDGENAYFPAPPRLD
jgi:hypothetical protein